MSSVPPYPSVRLARSKEVCLMLGIATPTLWRWAREREDFPKPIKIGKAITAWRVSELEEFIDHKRESPTSKLGCRATSQKISQHETSEFQELSKANLANDAAV